MCGRFTLRTSTEFFEPLFAGLEFPALPPRYNIAPTQNILTIRASSAGTFLAPMMRWGLVPSWATELKIGARMINARGETVATKPSFRSAFKRRRCLIPADGFYEWKKAGTAKQPYYTTREDDAPFFMAGLWESWSPPKEDDAPAAAGIDDVIETCTIITTEANEHMSSLHDRMPVILSEDDLELWTDPSFDDRSSLEKLLVPCPSDLLKTVAVSQIVNRATNETPECIEPV